MDNKQEIMEHYKGFNKETYNAIERYVDKFGTMWPLMGPKDVELIDYCVKQGKPIDDLPDDDPMIKKYFDGIIY